MHVNDMHLQKQKSESLFKNLGLRFHWDFLQRVTINLVRHNHNYIIGFGIVIISLELLEHLTILQVPRFFFVGEALVAVMLLGAFSYLFHRLLLSLGESAQANNTLSLKHDISTYLSASRDLEEVSKRLAQKTAQIVPSCETALFLFDENHNKFLPVLTDFQHYGGQGEAALAPGGAEVVNNIEYGPCRYCTAFHAGTAQPLRLCRQTFGLAPQLKENGYCLPLVQGSVPVGLLQLYPSGHKDQVEQQVNRLCSATGEISSALKVAMEYKEREANRLAHKVRDVQLDIARDLHDSIGQNIGFLRMRLDHLAETHSSTAVDMDSEIERMSGVANETYSLIRGTLTLLQAGDSVDLQQLLTGYARQVAERARFELVFKQQGQVRSISPVLMRQMFYIFREAITNIEKHACAWQVSIILDWKHNELSLIIMDDGRGFDPNCVNCGSHYGLKFMGERVNNLHGSFTIQSELGAGATIHVLAPYE